MRAIEHNFCKSESVIFWIDEIQSTQGALHAGKPARVAEPPRDGADRERGPTPPRATSDRGCANPSSPPLPVAFRAWTRRAGGESPPRPPRFVIFLKKSIS